MESPPPPPSCTRAVNIRRGVFTRASVSSSIVTAEPVSAPALERAVQDVGPGLLAEPHQKSDVVDRNQAQPQHVLDDEQVPEIASGIRGARLAITGGIERLGRPFERGAPHVDPAG